MSVKTEDRLLEVSGLKKDFKKRAFILGGAKKTVHAVDGVSFFIRRGETFGLVGESGCGKSTLGRSILRLIEPDAGSILFEGTDVRALSSSNMRLMRKKMQIIFQDPYASLNPRMNVGQQVRAPLDVFKIGSDKERARKVIDILNLTGMDETYLHRYPHEFSGGQRQRIVIARALITNPLFVVCDEPVSALDVSIRSQVLNLMQSLQERLNLTYLFISHDLSVVKHISDRVGVMYLGRLAELADKQALYDTPLHPYTQALLSSIPIPDVRAKRGERALQIGDVPSPYNPPAGCLFHPRCPQAEDRCRKAAPRLTEVREGHFAACHLHTGE